MLGRAAFRLHEAHGRDRLVVGPGRDLLPAPGAVGYAGEGESDRADRARRDEKKDAARVGRADGRIGRTWRAPGQAWDGRPASGSAASARASDRRACTMANSGRHEQQRREGREEQAADDRAARAAHSARWLDRHRRHADDHGERRHQHRAESRARPPPARPSIASLPSASRSRAKLTTRMLFAVATPMHMIAPVRAGTDKRRMRERTASRRCRRARRAAP